MCVLGETAATVWKLYRVARRSIIKQWRQYRTKKSSSKKPKVDHELGGINEICEEEGGDRSKLKKARSKNMNGCHSFPRCMSRQRSRRHSKDGGRSPRANLLKNPTVDNSSLPSPTLTTVDSPSVLSKNWSSRRVPTPIMFSNSSGTLKPPPLEKQLECTLEDLCFGCTKKMKVTRAIVKDSGEMSQEEELITIEVKPGWKKGTKIRFEGLGNERPGAYPADIIFVIAEKFNTLFRREGDDLELALRIPLVEALTGCKLSIPLLGGETMKLKIDDIIYPGYEKVIPGQGMAISKQQGNRGNLRVIFLVDFPSSLTHHQRSETLAILENSY